MTGRPISPPAPLTLPRCEVAPETFLIPHVAPVLGAELFLPVNSLLVRGREPAIIDTGAPIHLDSWLDQVFSLVEPQDVRWVFLSHDDGDHMGGLRHVLLRCPNATLITNYFAVERLSLEDPLPLHRLRWLEPGESIDIGDRRLYAVRPPIFDGPTTRGVFDDRTRALWAVDSFAGLTPSAQQIAREDIPPDVFDETFARLNRMISPWHEWLDLRRYGRHLDQLFALRPEVVTSAHGPVLTGRAIEDAFDRLHRLAGAEPVTPEDPLLLDRLVADAVLAHHHGAPPGLVPPMDEPGLPPRERIRLAGSPPPARTTGPQRRARPRTPLILAAILLVVVAAVLLAKLAHAAELPAPVPPAPSISGPASMPPPSS